MKPHPALTPLPSFNTRPLTRVKAGRPVGTCCGCFSQDTKRTALGTYYCDACLASAKAFAETLRREGDRAGLEVRL